MRKGAQTAEDLIEHVDKDSYALVLLPSGDVHRIESERVWPAERGLCAIGSGGDLALGWLSRIPPVNADLRLVRSDVRRAFAFVAKKRSDCGGGVDFRSFRL